MNEELLYNQYLTNNNDPNGSMTFEEFTSLRSMLPDEDFMSYIGLKKKEATQPTGAQSTPTEVNNTQGDLSNQSNNQLDLNPTQQAMTTQSTASSLDLAQPLAETNTSLDLGGAQQSSSSDLLNSKRDYSYYTNQLKDLKSNIDNNKNLLFNSDLYKKKNSLESSLNDVKTKIGEIQNNKDFTNQINSLNQLVEARKSIESKAVNNQLPTAEYEQWQKLNTSINAIEADINFKTNLDTYNNLVNNQDNLYNEYKGVTDSQEYKSLYDNYNNSVKSFNKIANSKEYKQSLQEQNKKAGKATLTAGSTTQPLPNEKVVEENTDFGNGVVLPNSMLPELDDEEQLNDLGNSLEKPNYGKLRRYNEGDKFYIESNAGSLQGADYIDSILKREKEGKVEVARNSEGQLIDKNQNPITDNSNILWRPTPSYRDEYNKEVDAYNASVEKTNADTNRQTFQNAKSASLKTEEKISPLNRVYNNIALETGNYLTEEEKANFKNIDDVYDYWIAEKTKKEVKENPKLDYNTVYEQNKKEINPTYTDEQNIGTGQAFIDRFKRGFKFEEDMALARQMGLTADTTVSGGKGYLSEKDRSELDFINTLSQDEEGLKQIGDWWNKVGKYDFGTSNTRIGSVLSNPQGRSEILDSIADFISSNVAIKKELAASNIERAKQSNLNSARIGDVNTINQNVQEINSELNNIKEIDDFHNKAVGILDYWKNTQTRFNEKKTEQDKTYAEYQNGQTLSGIKYITGNALNGIANSVTNAFGGVARLATTPFGSNEVSDAITEATKSKEMLGVKSDSFFSGYYDFTLGNKKIRQQNGAYFELKNGKYVPTNLSYSEIKNLNFVDKGEEWSLAGTVGEVSRMATDMAMAQAAGGFVSRFGGNIAGRVAGVFGEESAIANSLRNFKTFAKNPTNYGYTGWFNQTFNDNFKEGKSVGMSNSGASLYASIQSFLTAGLSRINPDVKFFNTAKTLQEKLITSIVNGSKTDILSATKQLANHVGGEIVAEEIQENTEQFTQQLVKIVANSQLKDKKFDDMTVDDVLKTVIITGVTTGIMAGKSIQSNLKESQIINYDNAYYNAANLSNGQKLVMLANLNTDGVFAEYKRQFITGSQDVDKVEQQVQAVRKYLQRIPEYSKYSLNAQGQAVSLLYQIDEKRKELEKADESFHDDIKEEINTLSTDLKTVLSDDLKLQDEQPQTEPQPKQTPEATQGQTNETIVQPEQATTEGEQSVSIDLNAKTGDTLYKTTTQETATPASEVVTTDIPDTQQQVTTDLNTTNTEQQNETGKPQSEQVTQETATNQQAVNAANETTQTIGSETQKVDDSKKEKQLNLINSTNPAPNNYNTWVRSVDDIKTWDEVLQLGEDEHFTWGDFSREDAEQAQQSGEVTVYSSNPIEDGSFVSTSKIQAEEYAGGKGSKIYSKTIPLTDVAWLNGDEGQYAKVDENKSGVTNLTSKDSNLVVEKPTPVQEQKTPEYTEASVLTEDQQKQNLLVSLRNAYNKLSKAKKGQEAGKELFRKIQSLAKQLGAPIGNKGDGKISIKNPKTGKEMGKIKESISEKIPNEKEIETAKQYLDDVSIWNNDVLSPHWDSEITWAEIKKGTADIKAGNTNTVPARRLINEINRQINDYSGFKFKQGSGNKVLRTFVSLEEINNLKNEYPKLWSKFDLLTDEEIKKLYDERQQSEEEFYSNSALQSENNSVYEEGQGVQSQSNELDKVENVKSPEYEALTKRKENAEKEVKEAQKNLEKVSKATNSEFQADQENLFGERESQAKSQLFDERANGEAGKQVIEQAKTRLSQAKSELSSVNKELKAFENGDKSGTSSINFSENENTQGETIKSRKDFEKLDFSSKLGLNTALDLLNNSEKKLDEFSKGTLGMNLPIVVAKGAIKAMKLAVNTVKTGADLLSVGLNYVRESEWYQKQTKEVQDSINKDTLMNALIAQNEVQDEKIKSVTEKAKEKISTLKEEYKKLRDKVDSLTNKAQRVAEKIYWRKQAVNEIKLILKDKTVRENVTDHDILRLLRMADKIEKSINVDKAFDNFVELLDSVLNKDEKREQKRAEKTAALKESVLKDMEDGLSLEEILDKFKTNTDKEQASAIYYEEKGKEVTPEEALTMMDNINEREKEMLNPKVSIKQKIKNYIQKFNQSTVDRQFLPKKYLKLIGAGNTLNRLVNFGGAASRAKAIYDRAYKKIYLGLTEEEIGTLNNVIQNLRVISIAENREARGLPPIKNTVANTTSKKDIFGDNIVQKRMMNKHTAKTYLEALKAEIGEEKFNDLERRAKNYFAEFKTLLDNLLEEGMIRQEAYDAMAKIDYQPRIFLQHLLDYEEKIPKQEQQFRNKNNGLTKDLIRILDSGSEGVLLSNSQLLLASAIGARTQSIMMNDVNKTFITEELPKARVRFSKIDPNNFKNREEKRFYNYFKELDAKIIVPDGDNIEAKQGYTKSYYFDNGVRKEFLMEDELHTLWNDKLKSNSNDLAKYVTGSALLKAAATGYNPAFVIANTPRDFLHTLAFSPEYNGFVPYEIGKLIADTGIAAYRIAKYNRGVENLVMKYFEYGGGMDFLNTQGMLENTKFAKKSYERTMKFLKASTVTPSADMLGKIFHYASFKFLSNYSELSFRIANFTRSIHNQVDEFNKQNGTKYKTIYELAEKEGQGVADNIYHHAVTSSRNLLDFNQGGTLVKDAENYLPYLNAGVQGTRSAMQAFSNNPVKVSLQLLQIATIAPVTLWGIGLMMMRAFVRPDDKDDNLANYLDFRDSLTKNQKDKSFSIPIGYNKDTNTYETLDIAKTQALAPLFNLSENIMENQLRRQVGQEEKSWGKIIQEMGKSFSDNVDPLGFTSVATAGGSFSSNAEETIGKLSSRQPFLKGVATYVTGYDFYFNQDLEGKNNNPELRAFEGQSSKRVEQFYKDFGLASGFSPVRTKAFVESLITSPTTNPFVGAFYSSTDILATDVEFKEGLQDYLGYNKDKEEWRFREMPIINRAVRETSDFSRQLNTAEDVKKSEKYIDALKSNEYLKIDSDNLANKYKKEIRSASSENVRRALIKEGIKEASDIALTKYKDDLIKAEKFYNRAIDKMVNYDVDGRVWDVKYEAEGNPEAQALLIYSYFGANIKDNKKVLKSLYAAGLTSDKIMFYYTKLVKENK